MLTAPSPFVRSRADRKAGIHPSNREVLAKFLPGTTIIAHEMVDERGAAAVARDMEHLLGRSHAAVLADALAATEADAPPPVRAPRARHD